MRVPSKLLSAFGAVMLLFASGGVVSVISTNVVSNDLDPMSAGNRVAPLARTGLMLGPNLILLTAPLLRRGYNPMGLGVFRMP